MAAIRARHPSLDFQQLFSARLPLRAPQEAQRAAQRGQLQAWPVHAAMRLCERMQPANKALLHDAKSRSLSDAAGAAGQSPHAEHAASRAASGAGSASAGHSRGREAAPTPRQGRLAFARPPCISRTAEQPLGCLVRWQEARAQAACGADRQPPLRDQVYLHSVDKP